MRMLVVLVVAAALVGCASPLREAIDSGNIEHIEARLQTHGIYDTKSRDTQKEAVRVLSEHYANEFLRRPDREIHVGLFDQYCREKIPTAIKQCSEESRQRVIAAEYAIADRKAVARRQEIERIRAELASGKREINSLLEAELALQPAKGDELLFSPRVDGGDGEYYEFTTYITAKQGDHYLSWWPDADRTMPKAGAIILKPKAMYGDVRFGIPVGVVGKYVGNRTIRLANGGQAVVPVFAESYVSN